MEGQCLCKAVTLNAKAVTEVDACHCTVCRRWGGAPMMKNPLFMTFRIKPKT